MNGLYPQDQPRRRRRIPVAAYISTGVFAVLIGLYGLFFFTPKPVALSYGEATCAAHPLVLPTLHAETSSLFTAHYKGAVTVLGTPVFSGEVCFTPSATLTPGTHTVSVAPLGGWFAKKTYRIEVGAAPRVAADFLSNVPISTATPLEIPLTQKDIIHTYALRINDERAPCTLNEDDLLCPIEALGLQPGSHYEARLERTFKNGAPQTLIEDTLETLAPLKLTKASIKNKQTIYTKPTPVTFTFDAEVGEVEAALTGKDDTSYAVEVAVKDRTVTVTLPEDLARRADYVLAIDSAVSTKGNTLSAPVVRSFTLSGGPKVAGVSIGQGSVARSAQVTLTFDQPIHKDVAVQKFIQVQGVPAAIQKTSATQVRVQLQNAPLCKPFTITVAKGMQSGVNGETGDTQWSHGSRIICGESSVIGYSVKGRPIIAHTFGSGAKTILFTGAIHGSEVSAYTTMSAWVQYLQTNGHTIPADKRIVVVPNANPDGVAAGTRNNANNVNLGRNFPTANWRADIDTASGVIKNGGGKSAGSEPEVKALMQLTQQLRPRLEVSFHSQGSLVGANKFGDSIRIGDIYAKTAGYRTMYYNAEQIMGGYTMTGEYEDWMGESMGIPAILIELPSHHGNYLQGQLAALLKMVNI